RAQRALLRRIAQPVHLCHLARGARRALRRAPGREARLQLLRRARPHRERPSLSAVGVALTGLARVRDDASPPDGRPRDRRGDLPDRARPRSRDARGEAARIGHGARLVVALLACRRRLRAARRRLDPRRGAPARAARAADELRAGAPPVRRKALWLSVPASELAPIIAAS